MPRLVAGFALALVCGTLATPVRAATPNLRLARVESQGPGLSCTVSVAVDDTGVADWDYLNPRNPPYVFGQFFEPNALTETASLQDVVLFAVGRAFDATRLKPRVDCNGHVDLLIVNRSTSQDVVAKLEVPKPAGDCPEGWKPAGQTCRRSERVAATGSSSVPLDLSFITAATILTLSEFSERWWSEVLDATLVEAPTEERITRLKKAAGVAGARTTASFQPLVKDLPPDDVLEDAPPELLGQLPPPARARPTVGVVTAMAQAVFDGLSAAALKQVEVAGLRALLRRLPYPLVLPAARDELTRLVGEDRDKARRVLTTAEASASIKLADVKGPAATFSVEFFGSADPPANPRGYFRVWPNLEEPASTSALKTKIETSWSRDVALPKEGEFLADAAPYDGSSLRRLSGLGTLTVAQTLGNRAKASVTLKFRGNDFGGAGDLAVTASQYQLDVYNSAYVTASVGRFQLVSPTDGIAISETGDAVRLRFRELSLSRRSKRESAEGKADKANQDSTAWILTADNLATPQLSGLKSVSLVGLLGRESSPLVDADKDGLCDASKVCPHSYASVGGSLNFAAPREHLGGSLGVYHSRRFHVEGLPKGRGTVGLLTLTFTRGERAELAKPFKTTSLFGLALGYGTGDDQETKDDEGYIGETASFASDSAFLGSIAARLKVGDGKLIPPGLSNKTYLRTSWESRKLSPLAPLARLLGASEDDIDSRSLKVVWNFYRFNEPVGGSHDLGHEIVISTDVATPPGVTVALTYARFFAAGALEPALSAHEPWRLAAKLSVSLP